MNQSATTKLMPCTTCGRQIALDASTCPGCGARNTWVHPVIKAFIDNAGNLEVPPFTFVHAATQVNGTCETNKTRSTFQLMHVGLVFGFIALLALFISPALSAVLTVICVALVILGMIIQGPSNQFHTSFTADFSSGSLKWSSDNDQHWAPVRAFFDRQQAQ
jgi:hypothetical protein